MVPARRAYQLSGLAALVAAAFLGYQASGLTYYTRLGPGPGFFPRWLCGILALLALGVIARATWSEDDAASHIPVPDRQATLRIGVVVAALFAVAMVTTTLGFRLTMMAFYLTVIGALGRWRWVETPVLAVLGSFATYYVFVEWLRLPLPVGVFGF
jgi:putative tricarboxylic transport membrane protein